MIGYAEYATPEADPIADLADAVDNSKLQQNRKFVDNTEYYLVPVSVIDALLAAPVEDADAPEFDVVESGDGPVEVARVSGIDTEVTEEVPGTYDEDLGPDDEVDHEFEDEIMDDSDLVDLPDEPAKDEDEEDITS